MMNYSKRAIKISFLKCRMFIVLVDFIFAIPSATVLWLPSEEGGPDSRQGLVDVLYDVMKAAGIHVFRDDDELQVGDEISNKILLAIDNSKLGVPVFSRTFAASPSCLSEVERMVELGKPIMPIFYTAKPEDVGLRTELFVKDLMKHEKTHGTAQVEKWKDALKAISMIKGQEVNCTGYTQFSKLFVKAIRAKLKRINVSDDSQQSMSIHPVNLHFITRTTDLGKHSSNDIETANDSKYCVSIEDIQDDILKTRRPRNVILLTIAKFQRLRLYRSPLPRFSCKVALSAFIMGFTIGYLLAALETYQRIVWEDLLAHFAYADGFLLQNRSMMTDQ